MSRHHSISPEQVKSVLDASRLLAVKTELDPLLTQIAESATSILDCERASIFLHDARTGQLWSKVALKAASEIRLPTSSGIVGYAFTNNQIIDVPRPYEDPRFNPEIDRQMGFVTRSLLAAPMVDIDDHPLGVIQAVNKHSGAFTPEDRSLIELLAEQAGVAIQRYRLHATAMEILSLRREMQLARHVQDELIPEAAPDVPGLVAAGKMVAASIAGGDCFDLWKTPDERMGIFFADASGHGLAPALVVSQVRTLVRVLAEKESNPCNVLAQINARLWEDLEIGSFVTAFHGTLSPDGKLVWCSAGQGPIFVRESGEGKMQLIDAPMPPLASDSDWTDFSPIQSQIGRGGMLGLISDGIFEAFDPNGKLFGNSRLVEVLDQNLGQPPDVAINRVYEAVERWQQSTEPNDDQTVVLIQPG